MTALLINKINIIDYRMPLKRPYGTARGVTRGSKNFLVRLFGQINGTEFEGVGEAQPRHRLTGDIDHDVAWKFLQIAAPVLQDRSLNLASFDEALGSVQSTMHELHDLAQTHSEERNRRKPFRGTLLGIEVALLDLVARALEVPLSKLLGEERNEVDITVSTLSTQNSLEEFKRKVERQIKYPMVRVKGKGDFVGDSRLLSLVHEANRSVGYEKPIWMDLNEGFDESGAVEFIEHVAAQINEGALPGIITLEQPIPGNVGERLPYLQARADKFTSANGTGEIRIMPDESLWDVDDLSAIHGEGGCRAMNIKTAKAGGLLASLDLARKAVEMNPETNICVGGMVGTSDITTWSLLSLAKALPRLDYITAVPPGNVKQRISDPLTRFKARGSNVQGDSEQNGIGARLDYEVVLPFIHRQGWYLKASDSDDNPSGSGKQVGLVPFAEQEIAPEDTYRVLFLGDFHFGESYSTGGGTILSERGYTEGAKYLAPFLEHADFTVANLETPVVDPTVVKSPFEGKKRFLHWADPVQTPQALKELGVGAVSLANNHTLDYGREGLAESLEALRDAGLTVFGAGENLSAANQPLRLELPRALGGGTIYVYGSMDRPVKPNPVLDPFADDKHSGCAPLDEKSAPTSTHSENLNQLKIAFPHWGPNYKWRSPKQKAAGRQLVTSGFDLVLGHGAHCLQGFGRYRGKWIAYGLGNGLFQARGRFDHFVLENGILPFSFWAMLTVEAQPSGARRVYVRFYPVVSDNRRTDFQPRPVDEDDFQEVFEALRARNPKPVQRKEITSGLDELGHFVQLEISDVDAPRALNKASSRVRSNVEDSDKSISSLQGHAKKNAQRVGSVRRDRAVAGKSLVEGSSSIVEATGLTGSERLLSLVKKGRTLGTQLIADRAVEDGARAQWFGGATCILSWGDYRVLLQGNRSIESIVGAGIIRDKYVTKQFLRRGGARAPEGHLATSAEGAVEILARVGRPVVVKPQAGDRGRAVTVNVRNEAQVRTAFARAERDASGGVLVEEYIQGEEYRCLVTQNECVSIVKRVQANVVGDGASTIGELIELKNQRRREDPYLHKKPIVVDDDAVRYLRDQGLALSHVPSQGTQVLVRPVGNFSHGADVVECSELVGEDLKLTALAAVRSVPGMNWAGVDIVVSSENGFGYVLEVNSNSGIGSHHFPLIGEAKDIAGRIWKERRARATPIVTSGPTWPHMRGEPKLLRGGKVRLGTLVRESAASEMGLDVEHLGGGTYALSEDGFPVTWLRGCTTTSDMSATAAALNRHGTVRRILHANGVPLTFGKRVRTEKELESFAAQAANPISVTGYFKPWVGGSDQSLTSGGLAGGSKQLGRSGTLVAQEVTDGTRFWIMATTTHILLVVSHPAPHSLNINEFQTACETAVKAVRAVPELRWAAVNVVVAGHGHDQSVLVEGISLNPLFDEGSVIIAGSVKEFTEEILRPSPVLHRS